MRDDFETEIKADNNIFLEAALDMLPEKERAVIALRLAGYTQKECGSIVGLTRAAIGTIYKRGLEMLSTNAGVNNGWKT